MTALAFARSDSATGKHGHVVPPRSRANRFVRHEAVAPRCAIGFGEAKVEPHRQEVEGRAEHVATFRQPGDRFGSERMHRKESRTAHAAEVVANG